MFDSSVTIPRLISGRILERHPNLKIIQTRGGGLLPYQAGHVDKNAHQPLPSPPSDYLKRIFVDTVTPQVLTVRTTLEFYGPDKVVYSTDYGAGARRRPPTCSPRPACPTSSVGGSCPPMPKAC
jgi:aminocarboxymuconate-semialdehyde decarboxylase